ncbi:hypothetical protein [Brevundimonas diminuta]|uniref:hypothetical protein n=1 Tax=Brevundimonas diminuta TaxID=293 RepID=UPI0025A605D0|nr:hypothetical protein [Brevundimonas diminuta]MDM8352858.1 hypothetical protein [Brevundimonas diminuta]
MADIRLSEIEYGIRAGIAAVEALRTWVKGSEAYRICSERERALEGAARELDRLSAVWPKARALIAESERSYDRYVERDREACSCHLSAPCSFCTSQSDEDDDQAQQVQP